MRFMHIETGVGLQALYVFWLLKCELLVFYCWCGLCLPLAPQSPLQQEQHP